MSSNRQNSRVTLSLIYKAQKPKKPLSSLKSNYKFSLRNVLTCFDTAELLNWSILKKVYSQHLKSKPGEPASPLDKVRIGGGRRAGGG